MRRACAARSPSAAVTERVIGTGRQRETELFNGYEEEVAHLYAGMDLEENF